MRGDIQLSRVSRSSWLFLLCDGEASAFLSHRTRYSSDEAGDPTSGFLVPPEGDVDPPNVRSALFPWCSIYLGPLQ